MPYRLNTETNKFKQISHKDYYLQITNIKERGNRGSEIFFEDKRDLNSYLKYQEKQDGLHSDNGK